MSIRSNVQQAKKKHNKDHRGIWYIVFESLKVVIKYKLGEVFVVKYELGEIFVVCRRNLIIILFYCMFFFCIFFGT